MQVAEWLRRMMTKPDFVLGWIQAPGSNNATGLGASCASIAIYSALRQLLHRR
jgi:hypothetical protein